MSDKKSKNDDEAMNGAGLNRRGFLGVSALTGVALAGGTALGSAVFTRETWAAAAKDAQL
ncbi:twin-arginine translocation signal domain-containing protein, partial [Pseudomonas sp. AL03]|uniref:twin-arginine translocation signal domain-containing protein n=1 Tax=Pseudomonas sp. AL03 TaxID=3042230 RepID=UPI00249AFDA0